MEDKTTDQPRSIDIRSARAIALAMKYRFEGESLTRTIERILERYDAQRQPPTPHPSESVGQHLDVSA